MRNENNRKRARKERGFLSGFVLVIHVQSGLDGGEFALVDQTSRGQRIAMKEVTACKRENKTWLGTHIRTKQSILVCEFWLQTRNAWTTQSLLNTNQQQLCGADGKGEIAACRPSPHRKISIYVGTTSHWGAPGSAGKARPTAASCRIPAQSDRNWLPKAWTRCLIPQIKRVPSAVPCWRPGHGAGGPARPLGLVLRRTSPLPQCLCNMKLTFQIPPPNPSGGAAGLCFHPCAASKHCFSHAWAALLPAVLPDNTGQVWARLGQAWGSHCALLLVYSLTEPENFARCPVPCTVHGSHLLERGTNTFSYKEPWRPSTLLQMLAIAAILEVSTRCCRQKLALQVHRCVLRGASPAGIHKVPSGNIYQIRPSAKIWNNLVSWSQQGLAGSKAA